MPRGLMSAVATAFVLLAGPAPAGDGGMAYPAERAPRRAYLRTAPPIGPACEEGHRYQAVLLRCPPQVQVTPHENDILAWNGLIGSDRHQRKPYRELFSWSN